MKNSFLLLFVLVFLGCTSNQELEFDKPEIQIPKKLPDAKKNKGSVKTQVDETFETTISAIIEETYQNGNYYIKGKKEMLIEGQKQEIIISGVIRPYDISSDNSINSSQIANLKLLYDKDGVESEILETPWGTRFLRSIWPF